MKEMVLKNESLGEMRKLTDIGYGVKVEGKKKLDTYFEENAYFEEIRYNSTLDEIKNIYTNHGFKVISQR